MGGASLSGYGYRRVGSTSRGLKKRLSGAVLDAEAPNSPDAHWSLAIGRKSRAGLNFSAWSGNFDWPGDGSDITLPIGAGIWAGILLPPAGRLSFSSLTGLTVSFQSPSSQ